jgi:single-strand DNA-binding protein
MNTVSLIGRLANEPFLQRFENDKAMCKFTLAVKRPTKEDKVDWIPIACWDKTAEVMATRLHKGRLVAVEGSVRTRDIEQDGKKITHVNIVASHIQFLDRGDSD